METEGVGGLESCLQIEEWIREMESLIYISCPKLQSKIRGFAINSRVALLIIFFLSYNRKNTKVKVVSTCFMFTCYYEIRTQNTT